MTPTQLRNSILQYAMEGKLVKQDPHDEPASILLEKIKAEKEQLIKEKKIKRTSKLPEITADEIPYEIPKSWQWVRLGDLGVIQTGNTPKKNEKENYNGNIPFIKPNDIFNDHINYKTTDYLSDSGEKKGRIVFNDTLLVTCIGNLGRNYVINRKVAFNQQINSLTLFNNINSYLIHYFIMSPIFQNFMYKASSATTVRILNKSKFANLLVPLPPLAEQQRIVTKIEKLLPLVDQYEKSYDKLQNIDTNFNERLKKSILQYAMEGKLVKQDPHDEPASVLLEKIKAEKEQLIKEKKIKPIKLPEITADEIPYEIPKSWQWVRLGDIVEITSSSRVKKNEWTNKGIPFYRAREIVSLSNKMKINDPLYISEETFKEKTKVKGFPQEKDILLTGVGTLGVSWIVPSKIKIYFKDASVLWLKNIYSLNSYFLKFYFESKIFKNQINKTSNGTSVKTLTISKLSKFIIPLPCLTEQQRIVTKIEKIFAKLKQVLLLK